MHERERNPRRYIPHLTSMACTRTASSFASPSPTCAAEGTGAGAVSADAGAFPAAAARAIILATSSPPDISVSHLFRHGIPSIIYRRGVRGYGVGLSKKRKICGLDEPLIFQTTEHATLKDRPPSHRRNHPPLSAYTRVRAGDDSKRDCTTGLRCAQTSSVVIFCNFSHTSPCGY